MGNISDGAVGILRLQAQRTSSTFWRAAQRPDADYARDGHKPGELAE